MLNKNKFYFFDTGVFRTLRPLGPLESASKLNGVALETLVLHHLIAWNDYFDHGYEISYWHTRNHLEVDFILYGEKRLIAMEVTSSSRLRDEDFHGLKEFKKDYPMTELMMIYGGEKSKIFDGIRLCSAKSFFENHNFFNTR